MGEHVCSDMPCGCSAFVHTLYNVPTHQAMEKSFVLPQTENCTFITIPTATSSFFDIYIILLNIFEMVSKQEM